MKYYKLGKLPDDTIDFFKVEILKRKINNKPYQWILFDDFLNYEFLKIFSNTELKVQWNYEKTLPIQKAFYSEPGHGFRIHKDGLKCKSALNIVISCNSSDWVRWYDEDHINRISSVEVKTNFIKNKIGSSRDVNIMNYENIPFTHELRNTIGEVYVLDVESFHSFKCIGELPRIIIQTKFDGFPDFNTLTTSLVKSSFSNLIKINNGTL